MIKDAALKLWLSCTLFVLISSSINAQANVQVRLVSVSVGSNIDCDGFLLGSSDYAFEYVATDNTLGYSNNNPVAFGLTGDFNFQNNNNNNHH